MGKVDFLLVGQGIAGSILANELLDRGHSVRIVNEEKPDIPSLKASGVYNPVTGRKMVKTWLADELFAKLEAYYFNLEVKLSARFIRPMPIYRLFGSYKEQNDWSSKVFEKEYRSFVDSMTAKSRGIPGVEDHYGGLTLRNSGYVNVPGLVEAMRNYFVEKKIYSNEIFDYGRLEVKDGQIDYMGHKAAKVIFCEGPGVLGNPFWRHLPFRSVKGETLEIAANLPKDLIVNKGVYVLPKEGGFTVGSTYDHVSLDQVPSKEGIKKLEGRLQKIFSGEYHIVDAKAGIRPATYDRKPFIGFHHKFANVGIFNGFGSKGVSLIPYFAEQLVNCLEGKSKIMPEVGVSRVNQ